MSYCAWDRSSELNIKYHDTEWGVPLHDDRGQFEFLMMEVMQCGLNWTMMINKREIFRSCFDNFEYDKIAQYGETDIERIMSTEGTIRSRRKIEAIINNARCFQKIREEYNIIDAGIRGDICGDYSWDYICREKESRYEESENYC